MTSKGSDMYIRDILDFTESSVPKEKSQIVEFFAHTNILVTGGTGFLGKLLIEKLLRSCPDLTKIYVIVRSKKGKTALERFKENFDDVIYEKLRREQPNFLSKVMLVEGDTLTENDALSPANENLLMNTNIIFHLAAIVRFDEKIYTAANINVRNTKLLLTFARKLPNLKAFVYVSTAFSQCIHESIDEAHYKDILDGDKFLTVIDSLDEKKLEQITPVLLDKWPNTYVYTKAIAENIVLKYSDDLPVCITRPSIVTSTFKEPIYAWINNMYGATGVVLGSAVGLIHTLYCKKENIAEIIPADYVISNIISSAWDTANRKAAMAPQQVSKISDEERIPVYNIVTSCQNPICWGDFMKKNEVAAEDVPSTKIIWCYMLILNRYLFAHNLCAFFLHTIPAFIVDTLAKLAGRKPILLDAYRKIHKFSNVIHYFSTKQWKFSNDNVIKLWQKMNSTDREIFCFNIDTLDWDEYFHLHVRGLRLYMLNDSFDTIDEGQAKYNRLRLAHYTIILITSLLLLWIMVSFVKFFWSFCPLSH